MSVSALQFNSAYMSRPDASHVASDAGARDMMDANAYQDTPNSAGVNNRGAYNAARAMDFKVRRGPGQKVLPYDTNSSQSHTWQAS